jgi:YEATS domain-containing protein 1/3
VFNLHETFENPKRVVKKPPYSVRETGYAGFNIPVDIYFQTDEKNYLKVSIIHHFSTISDVFSILKCSI